MQIIRDSDRGSGAPGPTALSIGVFDGVHRGHQHVLATLRREARAHDLLTAVVTFDPHPAEVVRPESAPLLLTTLDQRLELLADFGVDIVYVVQFDQARAHETPEDFVQDVLVDTLKVRLVVIGEDFHFGHRRRGNVDLLRELGERDGFEVAGLDLLPQDSGAEAISSTTIRRLLAGGEVEAAAEMLGRPYSLTGVVDHGDERGRQIGFPTANVPVSSRMAWPADGVYAGWYTRVDAGERYRCAINIGRRPTFYEDAAQSLLEAHLLDFDGDLYGERAQIEFVQFLRSEQRFDGIDALTAQLKRDVERTRELLSTD